MNSPLPLSPGDSHADSGTVPPRNNAPTWTGKPKATADPAHAPTLPPSEVSAPGGRRISAPAGYEILGELGRGGMGVVYRVKQIRLNRVVALKMVLSGEHASASDLVRFLGETEAVAHLQHPNIVQLYEVGEFNGLPFFTMEYVEGGNLGEKLRGAPLPAIDAARLIERLARGVHYAHQHGVIHRDLKPANILLHRESAADPRHSIRDPDAKSPPGTAEHVSSFVLNPSAFVPKIADFGLAKRPAYGSGLTATGTILGTPSYAPPEQVNGLNEKVGPLADVYSLGAILYECLTGRPPFRAPTPVDTVLQVVTVEPVPPHELQPGLARDIETICLKCLAKEPARRYESADALASDLGRFLADRPIVARRAGVGERVWRWCRRNPVVAGLSAAVFGLLVALAAGSSLAAIWLNRERGKAVAAEQTALDKLWTSSLNAARAGRWSGRIGRRFASLDALAEAAAIRPDLELRNEAIACLALVDLRPEPTWTGCPAGTTALAMDGDLRRYARGMADGSAYVFDNADNRELGRLPPPEPGWTSDYVWFSRDGQFLAVKCSKGRATQMRVWDWQADRVVKQKRVACSNYGLDFSADGRFVALGLVDGSIEVWPLDGSAERVVVKQAPLLHSLAVSPDGSFLLASSLKNRAATIYSLDKDEPPVSLPHPMSVRGVAWRPDGQVVATACADNRIYLWQPATKRRLRTLEGHEHTAVSVAFSNSGELLASYAWDNTLRLWDPAEGRQLLTTAASGFSPHFSFDDRRLGPAVNGSMVGIWSVADRSVFRSAPAPVPANASAGHSHLALSRDGRLLTWSSGFGVEVFDTQTLKSLGRMPGRNVFAVAFTPDGKSAYTSGSGGVYHWPLARTETPDATDYRLGPPTPLTAMALGTAGMDGQGRWLASSADSTIRIWNLDNHTAHAPVVGLAGARYVSVSPDGVWIATGTWHGTGVRVFALDTGEKVVELPARGSADVVFSPDNGTLVVSTGEDLTFFDTASWQPRFRLLREHGADVPGPCAFNRDGSLVAVAYTRQDIRLLEAKSGQQLALLTAPHPANLECLAFSPEGDRLFVSTNNALHRWNLRELRRELAHIHLDWETAQIPPRDEDRKAVRMKFE